jgi:hypothetical protein
MKKQILHIAENSTFLQSTIELFEKYLPGMNVFLVDLDFIIHKKFDYSQYNCVHLVSFKSNMYESFIEDAVNKWKVVILHNIGTQSKRLIINRLHLIVPLHGIIWGWEIYDSVKLEKLIFLPVTRQKFKPTALSLKQKLLFFRKNIETNNYHTELEKLTSYSVVLDNEIVFLNKFYGYTKKTLKFNYPFFNNDIVFSLVKGKSVLLGNSATPENNHLDLIPYLKNCINHIDKIVIPLSYGDKNYGNQIEKIYTDEFENKIQVLRDFISLESYSKLLDECGFLVMGHIRQQALGNIYMGIYRGAKVFLHRKSFAYLDLKNKGFIVYDLESIELESIKNETDENVNINKALVQNWFSDGVLGNYILEINKFYN